MAENLKTATPDTSLPAGAFMFGADSQSAASPSVYNVDTVAAPRFAEVTKNAPLVLPATTGTNMRMVSPSGTAMANATCTIDRLYFSPIHFLKNRTLTTFGIYCSTLAAGSAVRIGLYEDAGGVPGAFVADFGAVDTTTTGLKEASISQAVVATKWYWGALVAGVLQPGLASLTGVITIGANTGAALSHGVSNMFHSQAYGALPSTDRSGASFTRLTTPFAFYWS